MTAFKRNSGWAAKFVLRGEQHWVPGAPFASKRQAQEAECRHRDQLEFRRSDETCASFAERWPVEWPRKASGTRHVYEGSAKRFADHFGPTPIGDVERVSARAWALTVPRNVSKVVATMYEDARNVGIVETNPFSNLRLPVSDRTQEVYPPSLEENRALLDATSTLGGYGPEFRALIEFTSWTGLRAGEVQALHWDDVDGDEIRVRRARKRDGTLGLPKNGRERTVALLPPAQVLAGVPRRKGSQLVFHTVRGVPLGRSSLHYAWRAVRAASGLNEVRAEAELPQIRFHDLRHFCATSAPPSSSSSVSTTSRSRFSSATRTAAHWSWLATGTPRRTGREAGYRRRSHSTSPRSVAGR